MEGCERFQSNEKVQNASCVAIVRAIVKLAQCACGVLKLFISVCVCVRVCVCVCVCVGVGVCSVCVCMEVRREDR